MRILLKEHCNVAAESPKARATWQQPEKVAHTSKWPASQWKWLWNAMKSSHAQTQCSGMCFDKTIKCQGCDSLMGQVDEGCCQALDETRNEMKTAKCDGAHRSVMDVVKDQMQLTVTCFAIMHAFPQANFNGMLKKLALVLLRSPRYSCSVSIFKKIILYYSYCTIINSFYESN